MACPFFSPASRLGQTPWARPPRLPLGDAFAGVCRAVDAEPFNPDETTLRDLCNRGYARRRCSRFPDDSGSDAVRFSVVEDAGGRLRIVYVIEKDYFPVDHGPMEYLVPEARFTGAHTGELLAAQARVFVESYLSQKVRQS